MVLRNDFTIFSVVVVSCSKYFANIWFSFYHVVISHFATLPSKIFTLSGWYFFFWLSLYLFANGPKCFCIIASAMDLYRAITWNRCLFRKLCTFVAINCQLSLRAISMNNQSSQCQIFFRLKCTRIGVHYLKLFVCIVTAHFQWIQRKKKNVFLNSFCVPSFESIVRRTLKEPFGSRPRWSARMHIHVYANTTCHSFAPLSMAISFSIFENLEWIPTLGTNGPIMNF